MANPKKPAGKTSTNKSSGNKSKIEIKPFSGKIEPYKSPNSKPKSSAPKSNASSKPSTSKASSKPAEKKPASNISNKKVVKKDGKVTVTYSTPYKGMLGTYDSKVRKIYDDKGNLIKGNQRVDGGYGSHYDIGIKGKKKEDTSKKEAPKAKTPVSKTPVKQTPSKSKSNPAYVKGVVEGLDRPQPKKKVETVKPKAPDMSTKLGSAKVSVPSKGKVEIKPNLGKPKSMTPPKTETKKVTPKVAPKAAPKPELIKMETVSSADAAKKLMESREMPKELAGVKPAASAPVEEKKGIFARMKERREARKAEKERGSAGEDLAMKKGGMVKYQKGGRIQQNPITEANRLKAYPTTKVSKARIPLKSNKKGGIIKTKKK